MDWIFFISLVNKFTFHTNKIQLTAMKIKHLLFVPIAFLGLNLSGQNAFWNAEGEPAYWEQAENWLNGLIPDESTKTVFNKPAGADCFVNSDTAKVKQLVIGDATEYGGVLIIKDGGVLETNGDGYWSAVGYNNDAKLIIEAGGVLNSAHRFHVGLVPPHEGVTPTAILEVAGTLNVLANKLTINDPGHKDWTAEVYIRPGGVINTPNLYIGDGGLLDVSGGTLVINCDMKDEMEAFVTDGKITANGGTEVPTITWNVTGEGREADTTTWITSSALPTETAKSDISYVDQYNPERVLCTPDPEKGIKLELVNLPDYYARDFTWSNGAQGREVIITEPGSYYVDYVWGLNNVGYSDTVNIEDLVNIVPNPNFDISFSGALSICPGSAVTATVDIQNNNGLEYSFWHLPTETIFTGSIDISTEAENTIRVIDSYGCRSDSTFDIVVMRPYPDDICMVTTDPATGKNMIIFEKSDNKGTSSYTVLRGFGQEPVGSESYDGANYIVDMEENPAIQAFRYFLETTDSCGNSEIAEISHKTIHLTANVGTSGEVNLIWQPYEGVQAYEYNFYRSTDSVNFTKIGSMEFDPSISQYSDYDPPTGKIYYQVGIEGPFNCQPRDATKSVFAGSEILSNVKSMNYIVGIDGDKSITGRVKIYPNPAKEKISIEFEHSVQGEYVVKIYNNLGSMVYENRVTENRKQLDVSGFQSGGLFLLQLTDQSGIVIYTEKIVIE